MELDPPTTATYWVTEYPSLTEVLSNMSGQPLVQVCQELALIAGDYMNMGDDEVLASFVNERVYWPQLKRNDLTR